MRVLVTGGAVRVGAAISRAFGAAGAEVIIHFHSSSEPAQALAEELGGSSIGADLATITGCEDLARATGPVDVLVNSAAAYEPAGVGSISGSEWDAMMALNARAPLLLTQSLLPGLKSSTLDGGGAVINLGDIGADRPVKGFLPYGMSKAAVHHLTRALALELAPAVRVNAIAPGTVLPPADLAAPEMECIRSTIPAARFGEPRDIASLAVYLALHAPYVTGQVWAVDGGRSVGDPRTDT